MALIENEAVLTQYDDMKKCDIEDIADTLQDILDKYTDGAVSVEALTSQDFIAPPLKPGSYGVTVSYLGYEGGYFINLTGKSPLEALQFVLNEIPKAIESIENREAKAV